MEWASLVQTQNLEASEEKLPNPSFPPLWKYTAQQFCMFPLILLSCRTQSTDCWQPAQAWAGACRNWFASWSPVLPHHFACKQALVASKASSSSKKPAWNHLSSLAVNLPSNCSSMERRKLRFVPIPSGLYLSAIPGISFLWELSKGCHRVSLSISFEGCKFRLQHRLVFNARTPSLVTGLPGPWRPHCWMHFDSCKKVFWTHRKGEHYRFELWRFSPFFAV